MTSLARQLQRLAVPHTQSVLAPDKRRASLLFDPKEAANLDREALFALGISGFEELENLDPDFGEFTSTLFSSSSQGWERSLQSREVNQQLDVTIRDFLIRLSPYFLLKSSHKALEWLIYRYHIHEFNIDEILTCVLPYHETKLFVRIVQLLPIDDPTHHWNWLLPAAKGGVPLTRHVVINHCRKDPGFLGFLSDMVPQFIKVLGPGSAKLNAVVALWTCILVGALQDKADISENVLGVLTPRLVSALKSHCLEYKAGAYMVFAQVVTKSQLKPEFLNSLLPVLSKRVCAKLCREALMCLAVVFQTQQLSHMPKKTFRHLCRIPGLVPMLGSLGQKFDIQPLLEAFLQKLVPAAVKASTDGSSSSEGSEDFLEGRPMYDRLLEAVLQDVPMKPDLVQEIARNILMVLLELHASAGGATSWQQPTSVFMSALERRYPTALDNALDRVLLELETDEQKKRLQEILGNSTVCNKHQLMADSATTLTLGLHHPSVPTRKLALQQLHACLDQGKTFPEGFVSSMIMARLDDDHPDVVIEVLGLKEHLFNAVEKTPLMEKLLHLLKRNYSKSAWSKVVQRATNVLCSKELASSLPGLAMELLPYLLVVHPSTELLSVALTVATAPAVAGQKLFSRFLSDWIQHTKSFNTEMVEESDILPLNIKLVQGLARAIAAKGDTEKEALLSSMVSKCRGNHQMSLLVITVAAIIGKAAQDEKSHVISCLSVLHVLNSCSSSLKGRVLDDETSLNCALQQGILHLRKHGRLSAHTAVWAVSQIIEGKKRFSSLQQDTGWISSDKTFVRAQIGLLDFILKQASTQDNQKTRFSWQRMVNSFSESFKGGFFACLLSVMWTSDQHGFSVSSLAQVASLHLLAATWKKSGNDSIIRDWQPTCMVFLCLLVALQHSSVAMRSAALQCIRLSWKTCGSKIGKLHMLLRKVHQHRAEILDDAEQVGQSVSSIFACLGEEGASEDSQRQREECLGTLLDAVSDPVVPVAIRKKVLHTLHQTPHTLVLGRLLPVATKILDKFTSQPVTALQDDADILLMILQRFCADVGKEMKEKSSHLELLIHALHVSYGLEGKDSPQTLAVNQVNKRLFCSLPSLVEQQMLVSAVLDIAESTKNPQLATAAHKTLKQLKLEAEHLIHELEPGKGGGSGTVKQRRRSGRHKAVEPAVEASLNWGRVTIILEVLQGRTKVKDSQKLVTLLFTILSKLLIQSGEDVEYRKRLVLSSLHTLTSQWKNIDFTPTQESVNMEVLVQCVRDMASPQTQQQALLVMAGVAKFFPDYILHNVMSIFTFVGTGLLTQDDSHSFQVITKTIKTLVPALMHAHQEATETESSLHELVGGILQVFVDARAAVPRHRCLLVFHTLLKTLDADRFLWLTLTLLMKTAVTKRGGSGLGSAEEGEAHSSALGSEVEFAVNISEHFPPTVQITAVSQVLKFLDRLVPLHSQAVKSGSSGKPIGPVEGVAIQGLSPQELRLLQFHLTRLLVTLLSRESFINQVVTQLESSDGKNTSLPDFELLIREVLGYLSRVARCCGAAAQKTSAKFWNALLTKIYEIMDKVTYLLPVSVLLGVVSSLLQHELNAVRRRALDLLSTRLATLQPGRLTKKEVFSLLSLLDVLVAQASPTAQSDDGDATTCQQMALLNIKILCRLLGTENPMPFKQVFPVVVNLLSSTVVSSALQSNALLCLAELVTSLKPHAISYLPTIVPPLLSKIRTSDNILQNELLITSSLTALHRLTQTLPNFLSPYLTSILTEMSQLSLAIDKIDTSKVPHPISKLRGKIQQQICAAIPARVLIPALSDCFTVLVEKEQLALPGLMALAKEHLEAINREDLTHHQVAMQNLFCQAIDLRNTEDLELSPEDLSKVEDSIIAAILAMVVRLSEKSFRPMFYKLYDWACREDTKPGKNRKLAFFKLCEQLAERLRSLFTLFVGHMLRVAVQLLEENNSLNGDVSYFCKDEQGQQKSCALMNHILGCLHQCLLHDTGSFVTSDIFKMLMQPLVDQLENTLGGSDIYEKRSANLVIPCVSQLAVACQDDSSAKTLNYQVLLKTRHTDAQVRLSAVQTVEAIAQKMGEDYMVLLPETIPFLAELMEDESEEVEHKCQQVIGSMEAVLGESLQKYF